MKLIICVTALFFSMYAKAQSPDFTYHNIRIKAINHATFQLWYEGKYYLVDPSVDSSKLQDLGNPDFILYTDIHGDHFNEKNLNVLPLKTTTVIVAPNAVLELIKEKISRKNLKTLPVQNGQTISLGKTKVDAIPMYNLTADRLKFHTKGRGNGYVLHLGKSNIYISGDTEDIPEMRGLKHIDLAFVCMNLPYTMDVHQAASAVLAFQPKVVIPYHYRGQGGLSDLHLFQKEVNEKDPNIKVELLKWY